VVHPTQPAHDPQPRAWFSLRSLRAKLQAFSVLLVVVPGALIALIALTRARSALEQAVGRQLAEVAHDTVEQLGTTIASERANMRRWAVRDVVRDVRIGDQGGRVAHFLRSLQEGGVSYRELLAIDGDGRVVAATDPAEIGRVLRDLPWAVATLAGDEFLAGPAPTAPGQPGWVEIAAPVRDGGSGTVIGALLGRYDWAHVIAVAGRLRRMQLPHGLTIDILLFDGEGRPLGESWREDADAEQRQRRRDDAGVLARALRTAPVPGHILQLGVDSLVGYDRGEGRDVGWLALVIEPLDEAFLPLREMEQQLALALVAVVLGAVAVATYLAHRMSRPLRELTSATQEIAHARAPREPLAVRSQDEIGQLASAFNAMTAQLSRAQDDLVVAAKFAFLGEVAAGVAHEVRTPLGILRSSAQMLQRTASAGEGERTELIGMMIEEVDRVDHVVDGLLELARPRELLVEPTPLEAVLARALDFADVQAREKGIAVAREFTPEASPARCDPEQIYQVALNLIVNALQILPAGGRITVRTLPRHDGRVGFEVSDDGPGIPPEARTRLFTPFFSLRAGGTGLGLALVQRVVQAHQGTVAVESAPGRGTTFRVELPVAGSDA